MSVAVSLGLIAGVTIFLGLPVALIPNISNRTRAFLSSISTGILIFLLVEIMAKIVEWLEELFEAARSGYPTLGDAVSLSAVLLLGLAAGLLGMVYFENTYLNSSKDKPKVEGAKAREIAMMIAVGIGIHNLTEGLAIAQAYAWGDNSLALFLAVGFGLHNATEGFGIAGPLSGQKPSIKFLTVAGLVAGLPTLLGAIVGSYWQSDVFRVFSFGLAAGAILYIIGELLHLGRQLKGEALIEIGLLLGFAFAFATEMCIVMVG